MHSLVHLATRLSIQREGVWQQNGEAVVRHVSAVFPDDEWENRFRWGEFLPHALQLLNNTRAHQTKDSTFLRCLVGTCLITESRPEEAISLLEHVFVEHDIKFSENDIQFLSAVHCLAAAYRQHRQVRKATRLLEAVTQLAPLTADTEVILLAIEGYIASMYVTDHAAEDAISILEAILVDTDHWPEDGHYRSLVKHELFLAYLVAGHKDQAVDLLRKIVEIEKTWTKDHPRQAVSYQAISYDRVSHIFIKRGQAGDAIKLLKYVVRVRQTLAADHPALLASQHQLSLGYAAVGRFGAAIKLLEHVVKARSILPKDNHCRLVSQYELARVYMAADRILEAIDLLEHVVQVEKSFTESSYNRFVSELLLGEAYLKGGQVEKATQLLENVNITRLKVLSDKDPLFLHAQRLLAMCLPQGQ